MIEAAKRQYVAIPPSLTQPPALAPLPEPAVHDAGKCQAGCYTEAQLRAALDAALNTLGHCWDQLSTIRLLSATAVASQPPAQPP